MIDSIISIGLGLAFFASLITGEVFFKKAYTRRRNPSAYWPIVTAYLFGALFLFGPFRLGSFSIDEYLSDFFTDGATRIAYELKDASKTLTADSKLTIAHHPKNRPAGCSGNYSIQATQDSSLIIWCKDTFGRVYSSYSTTYHLNFVTVPNTAIVEKKKGEVTFFDLENINGRVVVTGVR